MERVAHYKIVRPLGEGAMGMVYEGLDERLNMKVAIKLLSNKIEQDEESVIRFEREAMAAAQLKHPNIARVYYVGRTEDDSPFYAMEYLEGISLADVIGKRMRVTGGQMLEIIIQLAGALQEAAEKKVLHRDVKPGNVMIENDAGAKLVDFGLAKMAEGDPQLTHTGIAMGTPNYISPEAVKGEKADFRSDMYSLGVTFYEFLSGNVPFFADTIMGLVMKHISDEPPDLYELNPQYPHSVWRIIKKMLAKKPSDRFASFNDLIDALREAAAKETEFVSAEWTYCDKCGFNVIFRPDGICTVCGYALDMSEVADVDMYFVRLTGFKDKDARDKVAEHLQITTKRSPEAIKAMLDNLPQPMSPRLPMEIAKKLYNTLWKLGADAEIKKSPPAPKTKSKNRAVLQYGRPRINATAASGMKTVNGAGAHPIARPSDRRVTVPPKDERAPTKSKGRGLKLLIAGGIFIAALLIIGIVLMLLPGKDSGETEETSQAVSESAKEVKAPPTVYKTDKGNFVFRADKGEDESLLPELGFMCEMDLNNVKSAAGIAPTSSVIFALDNEEDAAYSLKTFGMNKQLDKNVVRLSAKGLKHGDAAARPTLFAQIARAALIQNFGDQTPKWLEVGFPLYVMSKGLPGNYNPAEIYGSPQSYMDDAALKEELEKLSPAAMAQSALFVRHIAESFGVDKILKFAKNLSEGASAESAFTSTFGKSRKAAMDEWFAKLKE